MGFSELKRETEIDSGGLLSFHLGKLAHLVKLTPDGDYALSDEGKEALRVIATISSEEREGKVRPKVLSARNRLKIVTTILIIALLAFGGIGVYQQQQIGTLSKDVSANLAGTVSIGGNSFWYMTIPVQMVSGVANGTTISFHGVNFTLLRPGTFASGVALVIVPVKGSGATFTAVNGTSMTRTSEVIITNATDCHCLTITFSATNATDCHCYTITSSPKMLTVFLWPRVQVTLPNGEKQNLLWSQNSPNTTALVAGGVSSWFTQNTHPITGMSVNDKAGTMSFYVQATS